MNRDDVRAYVTAVVAERLGRPVGPDERLLDEAGFDSLAIVAVIDRVEDGLGLELEPDLLVPETFSTVDTLTDAVCRSDSRSPA